jgi:hypothetical protein
MASNPASIADCAKSLSYLRPLKEGGYISEKDHDRIVERVRRDLAQHGLEGLLAEGQRKRMANGVAPNLHPAGYSGDYVNTQHADNNPFGMRDEENLNWHSRAGYHGMYPVGGYAGVAANPMGPMQERFADLRGIHSQTHAGGYASDEDRRPVMVHETHRVYSTDLPLGRLFEDAPGVSDATVQRLRNALLGMMDSR